VATALTGPFVYKWELWCGCREAWWESTGEQGIVAFLGTLHVPCPSPPLSSRGTRSLSGALFCPPSSPSHLMARQFMELLKVHLNQNRLNADEVTIMQGAMSLKDKTVKEIMTPLSKLFWLKIRALSLSLCRSL
jgi:hypothetical protein